MGVTKSLPFAPPSRSASQPPQNTSVFDVIGRHFLNPLESGNEGILDSSAISPRPKGTISVEMMPSYRQARRSGQLLVSFATHPQQRPLFSFRDAVRNGGKGSISGGDLETTVVLLL